MKFILAGWRPSEKTPAFIGRSFSFRMFSDDELTASSAIASAAALAAVILKLQFRHHRRIGVVFALTGNIVFIVGDANHQAAGQACCFPCAFDELQ